MKNNLHSDTLLLKMIFLAGCFILPIVYNNVIAAEVPVNRRFSNQVELNFKQDKKNDAITIKVK